VGSSAQFAAESRDSPVWCDAYEVVGLIHDVKEGFEVLSY